MAESQRFRGQVVLVTGASRGIGRAIAQSFAGEGARVALLSSHAEGVKCVADGIAAAGGQAFPLEGDVSREADVRRFVAQAEGALGPIDVLVNNAGIPGPTAPVTEVSLAVARSHQGRARSSISARWPARSVTRSGLPTQARSGRWSG